jgi:hypothetical protein
MAGIWFVMWALPAPVDAVLAGAAAFAFSAWISRVGA